MSLIDAKAAPESLKASRLKDVAARLGLVPLARGLVAWDVFEAVLTPGDVILMMSWRDEAAAKAFEGSLSMPADGRLRRVRIVRDYAMLDRREAPQYYPEPRRA